METPETKKSEECCSFVDKMADFLTEGGVAVAKTTGVVVGYSGKMFRGIKDKGANIPVPKVSGKWAKGLFTGGVMKKWGGERSTIKVNIAKSREKIEKLYYEIGKRGSTLSGVEDITEHASVKELVEEVKSQEDLIKRWEKRLVELEQERKEASARKKSRKINIESESESESESEGIKENVAEATARAIKGATFESSSQKVIFEKVTGDLLDDDIEIRILAASELGKIANPAAVAILKEALGYENIYLSSEIINSLISINDKSAVAIFKNMVTHENFRVRLGSLRGIYKLDGEGSLSYLVDSLKDEHVEVKKSAATFLGWVGLTDAVPALIQTIKDPDQDVKKAAVMSLSGLRDASSVMPLIRELADSDVEVREKIVHAIERISGRAVEFKIDSSGDELKDSVSRLKDWWQRDNSGDVDEASGYGSDTSTSEADQSEPEAEAEKIEADQTEEEAGEEPVEEAQSSEEDESAEVAGEEIAEGEDAAVDAAVDSEEAETEADDDLTESRLQAMLKKELMNKCEELEIEYSHDETKAILIKKILEKCGN